MDDRKKYWNNNYFEYWQERVKEANSENSAISQVVSGDKLTSSDKIYLSAIDLFEIAPDSRILEMGCGFGRSIPYLYGKSKHIDAIDISEEMIKACRQQFSNLVGVTFYVSESENTPFENDCFDYIVCFAVFDALYQKEALIEMNRILRIGGKILITGKNNNYHVDDSEAMIAEVNARKKGHPNYFTDVDMLLKNLACFGFRSVVTRYYERRGDFSQQKFQNDKTEKFYEYMFLFEKISDVETGIHIEISNKFSRTYSVLMEKDLLRKKII